MRQLFLIMSISGTIMVLMYCLVRKFFERRMKACWRQILLRLSVVLYLFPFAYFEFYPKSLFMDKISVVRAWNDRRMAYMDLKKVFVITNDSAGRSISKYELWYEIFCGGCILLTVILFIYCLLQFLRGRKILCLYSVEAPQKEQQILERLKRSIDLKQKIRYLISEHTAEPLIMGIFRPTIVIPRDVLKASDKEAVLLHELAHIKNRDIVWRLLGLIVAAFHWYNPICYFMNYLMHEIDEISSDEIAIATLSYEEKFQYCEMIIQMSSPGKRSPSLCYAAGFSGKGTEQVKRRIDEIMKEKKTMRICFAKGLGVVMSLCALSIGLIYTPPMISYADERDPYLGRYDFEIMVLEEPEVSKLEVDCEEFFVGDDGTVSIIQPKIKKTLCKHSYSSGVIKKHAKKANGGCAIRYYNAERCSACGATKNKKLYKTESYAVCPH